MAQVIIRNLPDRVVGRLRARAKAAGRSLEAELRLILGREAAQGRAAGEAPIPYGAAPPVRGKPRRSKSASIRLPAGRPSFADFEPVRIKGKPLSRTISEDRR